MQTVADLDGLINVFEQAIQLRRIHGNIPVTVLVRQETAGNPDGSFLEERSLPTELLISTNDPLAIEIVIE